MTDEHVFDDCQVLVLDMPVLYSEEGGHEAEHYA